MKRAFAEVVALALLLFVLATTFGQMHFPAPHRDFDLYYYGAVQERHGSYLETDAIIQRAREHDRLVPDDGVFGTPALVTFLYAPMSLLPIDAAEITWDLLAMLLVAFAIRRAAGNMKLATLAIVLVSYPISETFQLGNGNILIGSLTLIGIDAIRRNHDRLGGGVLGAATAFKLYPAFLLLSLMLAKRWRAFAWLIGIACVFVLCSIPYSGVHDSINEWHKAASLGSLEKKWNMNFSIPASIYWLTDSKEISKIASLICAPLAFAFVVALRKWPAHLNITAAACVSIIAQSIGWSLYFWLMIAIVIAIGQLQSTRSQKMTAAIGWLFVAAPAMASLDVPSYPPGTIKILGSLLLLGTLVSVVRDNIKSGALRERDFEQVGGKSDQ